MKAILFAVGCSALSFACSTDQSTSSDENQEIIDNLVQAGFPLSDIKVFDGKVYTGLDAQVSLEASREMVASDAADKDEQYRTTNLVGSGVTNICVNGSAYTGTFSTALNNAISNYNNLGLRWHMTRTSGSTSGCSATITARLTSGSAGGSSGFPSGGLPYNQINIASTTSQYGVNTLTHVITHELGHCVGFRHSDYYNRSISCGGSASNEGSSGVGAILVPGTPSTATVGGSIMNSCFRASETGRFTSTDVTALNALY